MLTITNGRIDGARFVAARCSGGAIKPEIIILHDTAGRLAKGSSVSWFTNKQCQTSAHIVIERDGEIVQMVPLDRKAFHAGESHWQGRQFCNSFSIGIEIVNPGALDDTGRAWYHRDDKGRAREPGFPLDQLQRASSPNHGGTPYHWMAYTPAQIDAVKRVCRAIVEHYPDVNDVTTHWAVSPGRKIDCTPLMPLADVRDFALGLSAPQTQENPPAASAGAANDRPLTFARSTEVQMAGATGTGGGISLYDGAVSAAEKTLATGSWDWTLFLANLIGSTQFRLGVLAIAGAAYWIAKRHYNFHYRGH